MGRRRKDEITTVEGFFTVQELARKYNVTSSWLYALVRQGKIKFKEVEIDKMLPKTVRYKKIYVAEKSLKDLL